MRSRRVRPAHRVMRGWLLALPSTGLAIAGHGVAGGGFPDLAIAVPLTVLIAWAGAALADRLRGLATTIVALGVIQLGLHLLLTQVAEPHHGHHAAGPPPVNGWAMVAAHAVATVLTAALLARASAALSLGSAALDWLRRRLTVPLPAPVAASPAAVVISATPARPGALLETQLRRVRSRRGPPTRS